MIVKQAGGCVCACKLTNISMLKHIKIKIFYKIIIYYY